MKINNRQFTKIKNLVYKHTGIQLTEEKHILIENRLMKLFKKELFYTDTVEKFLSEVESKYLESFINIFTTNKTNFFREIQHFNYMFEHIIEDVYSKNKHMKIYCSASSTGEEVWSILFTYLSKLNSMGITNGSNSLELLASDIDTKILSRARKGEYLCKDLNKQSLPAWFKKDEFFDLPLGNCRASSSLYDEYHPLKVKHNLLRVPTLKQMNLMDTQYTIAPDNYFDIVFCRNVLIYFSKEDQNKILKKLLKKVKIGGYLMLGHSESPLDIENQLEKKGFNIFRRLK